MHVMTTGLERSGFDLWAFEKEQGSLEDKRSAGLARPQTVSVEARAFRGFLSGILLGSSRTAKGKDDFHHLPLTHPRRHQVNSSALPGVGEYDTPGTLQAP